MNNSLKHIKVYESFTSSKINKILRSTKNSINPITFLSKFDIRLSEIEDRFIKKLPKKDAIKVSNDDNPISNKFGVYCLKLWYDSNDEYIISTVVGKDSGENSVFFTNSEIKYILSKYPDLKAGNLIPISQKDYENFRTGDEIIGYYSSRADQDRLGLAKVFTTNNKVYAIQDVAEGSHPHNDDWFKYGKLSWVIYNNGPESDNLKLHRVIRNNNEEYLNVSETIIDKNGVVLKSGYDRIENSEYAIIFYIDDILNDPKFKSVDDVKALRKDIKDSKDALKSNDIRYVNKSISDIGIGSDNISNLQKLILDCLCGDYVLISMINHEDRPLSSFSILDNIYNICDYINRGSEKGVIEDYILSVRRLNLDSKKLYTKSFNKIKNLDTDIESHEGLKEIVSTFVDLGSLIRESIKRMNITTIGDFKMVYYKLQLVWEIISNRKLGMYSYDIFQSLLDDFDINSYNITPDKLSKDLKNLKKIDRYIRSIFR